MEMLLVVTISHSIRRQHKTMYKMANLLRSRIEEAAILMMVELETSLTGALQAITVIYSLHGLQVAWTCQLLLETLSPRLGFLTISPLPS
jgi:sensor domain CHASE-containing protein